MPRSHSMSPEMPVDKSLWVEPGNDRTLLAYFEKLYEWHSKIKLLGLPTLKKLESGEREIPLDQLFVEPSVSSQDWREGESSRRPLGNVLTEQPRLIVLGDPGSGKSTLVNWIAFALSYASQTPWVQSLGRMVPFPVILRDLDLPNGNFDWDDLWQAFLARPVAEPLRGNPALTSSLLQSGQALILLDGVDEITSRRQREQLRAAVYEAWERYPATRWLITSRIVGYDEVAFERGEREFRVEDAESPRIEASRIYMAPFDESQIHRFARAWFGRYEKNAAAHAKVTDRFLAAIQEHESTRALARNPNLLTLMALIYLAEANLPDGRARLYAKISEAYLEVIDTFRDLSLAQRFERNEKIHWLSYVGFEMQCRRSAGGEGERGEILVDRDQLKQWLTEIIGVDDDDGIIDAFVSYLGRRTGLLIPRGENRYAFAHLSFQEYFAACYLESFILHDRDWLFENTPERGDLSNQDLPTSLTALRGYATESAWEETLYVLFEILGEHDRQGKSADALARYLFRDRGDEQALDQDKRDQLGELMVRVAADPHSGLRAESGNVFKEVLSLEASRMEEFIDGKRKFADYSVSYLQALTRCKESKCEEALQVIDETPEPGRTLLLARARALLGPQAGDPGIEERLSDWCVDDRQPESVRAMAGWLLGYLGDPRPGFCWKPSSKDKGFVFIPVGRGAMAKYPVTNHQYAAFVEDGGYQTEAYWTEAGWQWRQGESREGPEDYGGKFVGPNHPRVGVTFYEAVAYCRWLSDQLGRECFLPSMADYDAAVPRPLLTQEKTPEEANFGERLNTTSPVGIYPQGATPEDIHDLAGNVWEWSASVYQREKTVDREGTDTRRLRGGAYWGETVSFASAYGDLPNFRCSRFGFRVWRSPSSSGR